VVTLPVPTRRVAAFALAGLALLVVGVRHVAARDGTGEALRVAPVRAARAPARATARLVVDVEGAVRRPGLVRLPSGARVADAVAAAGGLARRADRTTVNLAAAVSDGQQVLVARSGATGAASASGGTAGPTGPVSLSRASAEELDTLPGVGPVTAQKIVAYREAHGGFRSVDELDAIPGIGPARLDELQGLVAP
jgi:competence protein ComEA